MNDHTDHTRTGSDFEAFEAWLEETAEREGTSPDAVLKQLMSTYWILNELSSLMEETPYEEMLDEDLDTSTSEESGGDHRAIVEVIESIAEMNNPQAAPEPQGGSSAIDPGVIQLIEAMQSKGQPAEGSGGFDGVASQYRLEKLRDEVETLSRELTQVGDRTKEMDDAFDATVARQEERLAQLQADVDEIEAALEETVDRDRLLDLEGRLEKRDAELQEEVNELDDRFEDAYASIKRILEHLLTSTESNAGQIDALVEVLESELEALAIAHEDYEALTQLKQEADRRDIRDPVCDTCEERIDLSLLASPVCPSCDRRISGFESESRLFGEKHLAHTRARRQAEDRDSELIMRLRKRLDAVEDEGGSSLPEDLSFESAE